MCVGTILYQFSHLLNGEVLSIKDSPKDPIRRPSSNSRTSEEGFSIKFGWIPEEIEIPSPPSFLIDLGREKERHQGSCHRVADKYSNGLRVVARHFTLMFSNCWSSMPCFETNFAHATFGNLARGSAVGGLPPPAHAATASCGETN